MERRVPFAAIIDLRGKAHLADPEGPLVARAIDAVALPVLPGRPKGFPTGHGPGPHGAFQQQHAKQQDEHARRQVIQEGGEGERPNQMWLPGNRDDERQCHDRTILRSEVIRNATPEATYSSLPQYPASLSHIDGRLSEVTKAVFCVTESRNQRFERAHSVDCGRLGKES
jgi:hypothetical protein